jgi:3-phenylpropionate/cinnamic acid dioxygenase small subunit
MMTPEDYLEIQQVNARYAHVIDSQDWDNLPDVFTDDAVIDRSGVGLSNLHGYEEIRSTLGQQARLEHYGTNLEITLAEGDRVEARSKFLGIGPNGRIISGEYEDVWRRTPAGWRIARRRAFSRGVH